MNLLVLGTVSFGWALLSMLMGMTILAIIGVKVWSEVRELRREREAGTSGEEAKIEEAESRETGDGGRDQDMARKKRDE